jgi:hypothetical protein
MKQRYMPEYIFNIGTATAVRTNLRTGASLVSLFSKLAFEYRLLFKDDGFEADWISAGEVLIVILEDDSPRFPMDTADFKLRHMQYFFKYYKLDGSKKLPRFLRGEWIVGELEPVKDRMKQFFIAWAAFHMHTSVGKVPLPPPGWQL